VSRVLVAGVGNVFLGDDAFGVEVVRRLTAAPMPDGVDVADFGIGGVHLAYELLDGRYDTVILVDAVALDEPPGTVSVVDATPVLETPEGAGSDGPLDGPPVDSHGMHPDAVLSVLRWLGAPIERVLVVGGEPASVEERMGLSESMEAAVGPAVDVVRRLAAEESRRERGRSRATGATASAPGAG
jgi:hydrogenase maturation protease